jgi:pyruvate formate lyase activating enzyme
LVPGFNTGADDLGATARFLRRMPRVPGVTLQPFHRLAAGKAGLHGAPYAYAAVAPPGKAEMEAAAQLLEDEGVRLTRA